MTTILTAIYENGVLRPLGPLVLPEHARVQIQVREIPDNEADIRVAVAQALLATGLVRRLSLTQTIPEIPELERQPPPTLPGIPVSEIIIAQRQGEL